MSHASGEVIRDAKVIGYFEYDGTSDYPCSAIQPTEEALGENWRSNYRQCKCESPQVEDVLLWTKYGGGFWWPSKACLSCMTIVGAEDPFGCGCDASGERYPIDGHPLYQTGPDGKRMIDVDGCVDERYQFENRTD